jgi:hypothetical protein
LFHHPGQRQFALSSDPPDEGPGDIGAPC